MASAAVSTAPKAKTSNNEVLTEAVRAKATPQKKTAAKTEDTPFANIEANAFIRILFQVELSPEQKREEIAKALTYAGTKEENRARVHEFELAKEFLQHSRSEMAQEIIRLTDTEAFSELKRIYDEINGALVDFDNKMRPLTEIIDAVYTLRTNGEALNAFREIQEDRDREKARQDSRRACEDEAARLGADLDRMDREIATESQKKSFFGLGGIKADSQERINALRADVTGKREALEDVRSRITALNSEATEAANKVGEYAAEKAKLRELLDISTDAHQKRQEDLVNAALHFVTTAKERIGAVRSHLGTMNGQVENLGDANNQILRVYAILNEGIRGAEKANQGIRATLAPVPEEDLIAKMTREEKLSGIDSHIKLLDSSAADTMMTYTDLTTQAIRINAMKDSNDEQITGVRAMHAQGVAGVADRLSVVLQAVSSAAINESSSMARDTLSEMANTTNRIAQKEVIRVATGVTEQNAQIMSAIEGLSSYGDVLRAGTEITRSGVKEMREKLEEMRTMAEAVQQDIRDHVAVHSEVGLSSNASDKGPAQKTAAAAGGLKFPFKV